MGKVPYLKMLASDRRGVESESMPGFGTVTFCNRLIINDLLLKSKTWNVLVSLPEDGEFVCRFSAVDANPCSTGLLHWDAPQSGLGLFLNLLFAPGVPAPIGTRKSLL